jgi:imidazole glycerol-phosphate synthase subunit HisF
MLKKRLIFNLLYSNGYFMLSRNFTLQQVGDINWLRDNYKFWESSKFLDEIIILDVSREESDFNKFIDTLQNVVKSSFIPVAVGGGIRRLEDVDQLIRSGADKVVINSMFYSNPNEVKKITSKYGIQSVVASIDYKRNIKFDEVYINNGSKKIDVDLVEHIKRVIDVGVGEILLNSMDQDGTGRGFDLDVINRIGDIKNTSLIISGGAGREDHFSEALVLDYDAASTANLFNFVGEGLKRSREDLISKKINIPLFDRG